MVVADYSDRETLVTPMHFILGCYEILEAENPLWFKETLPGTSVVIQSSLPTTHPSPHEHFNIVTIINKVNTTNISMLMMDGFFKYETDKYTSLTCPQVDGQSPTHDQGTCHTVNSYPKLLVIQVLHSFPGVNKFTPEAALDMGNGQHFTLSSVIQGDLIIRSRLRHYN